MFAKYKVVMNNPTIIKYNLSKFWDDEFKSLKYINEEFNDVEKLLLWKEQGYSSKVTGDMCDMRDQQPSWNWKFIKHYAALGWKDIGTSYYCMTTGTVLPTHGDLYLRYISLFNLQGKEHTIRRAVVFLEDWQPGHYSEQLDKPYVNWQAGDTVEWAYDTSHMAANLGRTPRYTLQITGHV
ncbi:hypothetical protein UFOVP1146_118 [uncultured Caudovirales phage]|uniref:Uncharacterized protein n=1 Tax=uncultured Caudovirales phage TaxID=2100421 RepID=A0A6J5P2T2_9CAUD|nr:hypothetical protein UFOVP812_31 [uncultured Caudovirales phage]CAB4165577.1 hypothetical protein UFOVP818_113 [uncultured Caudovirales phage]CAB4186772.1 hypothetical protein UFOVP1146_118 [uncultured Caudovirales phage]CAB4220598.1 hypothetical protein UFOVP1638_26 [uncultured Caudovirales phage]